MKKSFISIGCLLLVFFVTACTITLKSDLPADSEKETTEEVMDTDVTATDATATTEATSAATATTTTTPTEEETTTTTPTEEETTATTHAAPVNTATMYTSYAEIVSYDPATGWAEFDYFDLLTGDTAVQWLVDNEGYTLADAQALVDDFADSEFVYKNINPQLRTVDLSITPFKLMYYPDGTKVMGADPVDTSYADMNLLFSLDPDLILDSFFFHVTVTDGAVVSVEQVYWP